jgi:tRNA threonylcarbamoyladenosine biosynthesis protein TsaB
MLHRALGEAGWSLQDVDGIAFGSGPGSFTGVRIACGIAQGLALGADRPVVPVPTLAALAHEAYRRHGWQRVLAGLDARMREVYVAAYARGDEAWRELAAPAVLPPASVALPTGATAGKWSGAGNAFVAYSALASQLALTEVDGDARPTGQAVGELALPRLRAGEGVAAAEALPMYVRHRVALTTAEREAGLRL